MGIFILNQKLVSTDIPSGVPLLDFIREHQGLKGTKIGCREGDCGACTVLIGSLDKNNEIKYRSITSCISPIGNAFGKHVVTVEGVNLQAELNVAQAALNDHSGTQCGFCTPGFVMSLTGMALSNQRNHTDAMSGNICRCTGYKSIEKAGKQVVEILQEHEQELSIKKLIQLGFIPDYFHDIESRLKNLNDDIATKDAGTIVGGGTDLYVRHADQLAEENVMLIAQKTLQYIEVTSNKVKIGAGTTVADMWHHKPLNDVFPNLRKHLKLVSSEQIRNMATLAGNFVNASPIGDMSIFFLALNAYIIIRNADERTLPLKQFFLDYKKYDLHDDEVITQIEFDIPTASSLFNFEKVSKRTHLDIASVNSAMQIEMESNTIRQVHLSLGGVSAIPKYCFETSHYLSGKILLSETIKEAANILQKEISPISDVRGSAKYKRTLARQLFFAHFIELFPDQITLNDLI